MTGVKFIAKCHIQLIEGSSKHVGIVSKIFQIYTDQPMGKVIQKISLFGIT